MPATLILGIGDVHRADEGFGVHCVQRLAGRFAFPAGVRVMDGGTQAHALAPFLGQARRLMIFDAVDYGLVPGTLTVVQGEAASALSGARRRSGHQRVFQDALATARRAGRGPEDLVLVGCQPAVLPQHGDGRAGLLGASVATALALALNRLARWGIVSRPGATERLRPRLQEPFPIDGGRPFQTEPA